jgi:hypothetical protein
MNLIDHGDNDSLEFTPSETPDETRAWLARLRYEREQTRRSERYKAQLAAWVTEAGKAHTPDELAAIEADQARRIRAMGNK